MHLISNEDAASIRRIACSRETMFLLSFIVLFSTLTISCTPVTGSGSETSKLTNTNIAANTNCKRVNWEMHCDISEGTVDIGDGVATAVRLFNRTGKTLQLESVHVPWFAGNPTGCFAEFGITRNDVRMGQPHMPYVGEFGFSPKLANESIIPAIALENGKGFRIDPNDTLTLLAKNGCYENKQLPIAIPGQIPSETPMTFRVTFREMTEPSQALEIWRQPRMDPIYIACNGETQFHSGINFNRHSKIIESAPSVIQTDGPWQNRTGRSVEILGAFVYAVGGDGRDHIDNAQVHVCRDSTCSNKIATWSHESLRKRGQSENISMWVAPNEYVLAEVSNTCTKGENWNYVAFLKVSVPGSEQTIGNPAPSDPHHPPAPPASTQPVHRKKSSDGGDYLYTTDIHEGAAFGYQDEGVAFHIFSEENIPQLVALYRCNRDKKHFLSRSETCDGAKVEGKIGYIYGVQKASTTELFVCQKEKYLVTTHRQECTNSAFSSPISLGFVKN